MTMEAQAQRLDQVAQLLPQELRCKVGSLSTDKKAQAEELRLRVGRPLFVLYPDGERPITGTKITPDTLSTVLELASGASVHTVMEQVKNGFIPIQNGHRLGLCGTGVVRDGTLINLRAVSSISLRVAREFPGIAQEILPKLLGESGLYSTLILSPPGGGKTTLLRDLIRAVSTGEGCDPLRVGLADERGELAAVWDGVPTLDVGERTDIMDGCPKEIGLTNLLRGMNPQVLAVDEITAQVDADAISQAAGCGVALLATAHGGSAADLRRRPLYAKLLDQGIFQRLVVIERRGADRSYTVTDLEGNPC